MTKTDRTPGMHGWGDMTLHYTLKVNARGTPNKEALIDVLSNKRLTYKQLDLETNKMANALLDLGLKKGDHIAWLSADRAWIAELWYATAKIGVVTTPINYRLIPSEMQFVVDHCDAKAFLVWEDFFDAAEQMRPNLPKVKHYVAVTEKQKAPKGWVDLWQLTDKASDEVPDVKTSPHDLHTIVYTSGTTAMPKGVMRDHHAAIGWLMCASRGVTPDVRQLCYMPMYHWGGHVLTYPIILSGATVFIMPFDPVKILETIEREKITTCGGAPIMFIALMSVPNWKKYDLSSWESTFTGAAPPVPALMRQVRDEIGIQSFVEAYTSTEAVYTGVTPVQFDEEILGKGKGTGGYPKPGMEISIRDINDRTKELPHGETGVIYGRGPSIHLGYYKNPEANEATFLPDGWQTSEDMGYIEPETGLIFITDRLKDMICTGGENVSSIEVENVVSQHPKVKQVAVIGTPDPTYNERVTALVVLKEGEAATPEEIIEFCRGKLSGFKRPRKVDIVDTLPASPSGKVLKKELRDEYWKGYERKVTG